MNQFIQNSAEWLHLLEAAGVESISFASPVVLDTPTTVALLESDIVLSGANSVAGTVTLNSLPNDFFDRLEILIGESSLRSISVIPGPTNSSTSYSLNQSLAEFNEWALDQTLNVRLEGFQIAVPDYLLHQQSSEWRAAVENHLDVRIVGTSDSYFQILYGET